MNKTLLLLAALAFTTAGTSFAQTPPAAGMHHKGKGGHHDPAQKADKMAKELGLNADQKARVAQLMATRQQEGAALKEKYGTDKKAGRAEMKAAHERYAAQFKQILTPEQYAKYDQMKSQHRGHGKMQSEGKMKVKTKA